jgi:Zn finger protein HypA/HybF involved in hydrogenase expression
MRDQAVINEKIRQRALERKANGTLKIPKPFKKGYDPRRAILTDADRLRGGLSRKKHFEEQFKILPFEKLGIENKRKKILLEQNYKCLHCHNDRWFGKKIVLELDHIDGNHSNYNKKNLRCLCPNCHSITVTWRRRKKAV